MTDIDEIGTERTGRKMAPAFPTSDNDLRRPTLFKDEHNYWKPWTITIPLIFFGVGLGGLMFWATSGSHHEHEVQQKKDIAECIARGGQVITESDSWNVKCVGGTVLP